MSRAVPIAQPLPEGFSIRKAIQCAQLVNGTYDLYQQWSDAGNPAPAAMRFQPIEHGKLVFSDPFWRTLTYRTSRESGGKGGPRPVTRTETTPAGVCARSGHRLFIVFRGTQSAGEKISNSMAGKLDAVFDNLQGGHVHRGFHRCYESVRPAIQSFLLAHAGPESLIRVTGHSLGGALASLAAMDIATGGLPCRALEVYTFASPRVGAARWARHFSAQRLAAWRIANRRDVVTKVPPAFLGYRHAGVPIEFTSAKDLPPHSLDQTYLPALRAAR
jgi:hypothetical protein